MRRRSAAVLPQTTALEKQLRILQRLSPPDYHAIQVLVSDVLERRLKRIQTTDIWRGARSTP
jgi:hypothetical protein